MHTAMTYRNSSRVGRFGAAATLAISLLVSTAVSAADPPALGKPTIAYAAPSWASGRMITEVGKILLEKVGYKVEVKLLDTGVIYQSLAAGKMGHGTREVGDLIAAAV